MINLTATDNSIQFEFINSPSYPQDGVIECPKNSLALITDDSNMASFVKSSTKDVFISATYDELGKTKAELIEWFKDNAVGETGGGGGLTPEEAQTMIDESISGKTDLSAFTSYSASVDTALSNKADVSSLTAYFDGAEYNSTGKTIEFYNNGVLKDSIDATAFIKDGMVDSVAISGNNLVISFNTDAGKEDIEIPLTDIFNPNNYYDKTATDGLLVNKLDVTAYTAYTSSTETALNGKASQTDLETVSGDVATKLATSDFNTYSGGVNTAITAIQGDIVDVQTALSNKVDVSAYTSYTSATDTALQGKADTSDLANYVETSAYTAYTSATDTALSGKASQTDLNTVSGDVATVSGSVANKQDLLVSGTNIKTVNGNSLLGSGNITIEGGQTVTSITQAEFDELVVKNPDTFYIISDATGSTITIDTSLDSGSTNAVANSAITTAINAISGDVATLSGAVANKIDTSAYTAYTSATDTAIAAKASQTDLNTVSAATASNTTSINTINTQLGGYSIVKMTSAQYEALAVKDASTIYYIVG